MNSKRAFKTRNEGCPILMLGEIKEKVLRVKYVPNLVGK